jgi:hypothetical protein
MVPGAYLVRLCVIASQDIARDFRISNVEFVNYIQAGELGDFTPDWISDKLEKMESRKTNIVQLQKKLSFLSRNRNGV